MYFYLSQGGIQKGPYQLFQIKEMLDRGQVSGEDLAWHDGLDGWQPLASLGVVKPFLPANMASDRSAPEREVKADVASAGASEAQPISELPLTTAAANAAAGAARGARDEVAEDGIYAGRPPVAMTRWEIIVDEVVPRAMARVIDVFLTWMIIVGIGLTTGLMEWWHIGVAEYFLYQKLAAACIWIFGEAWCLSRWGTTPGKWVVGLRVQVQGPASEGESLPSWRRALDRSISVWWRCWGCGYDMFLSTLLGMMAAHSLIQVRTTQWDHLYSTHVVGRFRVFRGVFLFSLVLVGHIVLLVVGVQSPPPVGHMARPRWDEMQRKSQEMHQDLIQKILGPAATAAGSTTAQPDAVPASPAPTVPPAK